MEAHLTLPQMNQPDEAVRDDCASRRGVRAGCGEEFAHGFNKRSCVEVVKMRWPVPANSSNDFHSFMSLTSPT